MKKLFIIVCTVSISFIAVSFKLQKSKIENLAFKVLEENKVSKPNVKIADNILIPPTINVTNSEGPGPLLISVSVNCVTVGGSDIGNHLQKEISGDFKKIISDIDMANLDK